MDWVRSFQRQRHGERREVEQDRRGAVFAAGESTKKANLPSQLPEWAGGSEELAEIGLAARVGRRKRLPH